jgi:acid phosphatase family membrane protein YuiD
LGEILQNNVLLVSATAWFIAQISKVIVLVVREHRFHFKAMMSAGGMPSSHSALVTALTTRIGIEYGTGSPTFALAAVFAGVVLYDAAGVRRAVSIQARTLNRMIEELFETQTFSEKRLIELLGHTPFEVFVGSLLGIVTAITWL